MKKILYILSVIFLACSCNWLEITPENAIDEDDLFTTGYGFRNALNGVYLKIGSRDLYGENLSWGFLSAAAQEYITDDSQLGSYTMQKTKDAADFIYKSANIEPLIQTIWETQYSVIANINKILEHIDNLPENAFAFGDEERNLIKAEAHALRAMLHFDLLRLFAPAPVTNPAGTYIPYRDKFSPELGDKLSVSDFIDKCLADIAVAEPLLKNFDTVYHPEAMYAYMAGGSSTSMNARYRFNSSMFIDEMGEFFWFRGWRMNYLAVLALKARVCIYDVNRYKAEAKSAALEIHDTYYAEKAWVGFTATENITATSSSRYFKATDDVLFGAYYKNLATEYDSELIGNDNTVKYPLAGIDNLFLSDVSGNYEDLRYDKLILSTNALNKAYYTGKYSVSSESYVEAVENPMIPIFRLSEVFQILAEVEALDGNFDIALDYLAEVRNARGAYRVPTVSDYQQFMTEYMLEARKESLCEGRTFFLYKRLNVETVENSSKPGFYRNMREGYVLPIPNSESPF